MNLTSGLSFHIYGTCKAITKELFCSVLCFASCLCFSRCLLPCSVIRCGYSAEPTKSTSQGRNGRVFLRIRVVHGTQRQSWWNRLLCVAGLLLLGSYNNWMMSSVYKPNDKSGPSDWFPVAQQMFITWDFDQLSVCLSESDLDAPNFCHFHCKGKLDLLILPSSGSLAAAAVFKKKKKKRYRGLGI